MLTPEFTISLADLKLFLKQLKLVMKSVKNADVLISYDGSKINIITQGMDTGSKEGFTILSSIRNIVEMEGSIISALRKSVLNFSMSSTLPSLNS